MAGGMVNRVIYSCVRRGWLNWMPDKQYLQLMFRLRMGKKLDLKNPKTYNEKLQWIKLYDRRPVYSKMVDKYTAKKYVADCIGEEYTIPTYGVWESFDDIDFEQLPDQFVLKCTHDSGGLAICRDKEKFNINEARKKIECSLKRNYYLHSREWPYRDVKPRIIAEQFMTDETQKKGLTDYKFYCFNGEPRFLYVSQGLEEHSTASISFLTMDWEFQPFRRIDYKPLEKLPKKPVNYSTMVDLARKLSYQIPFVRVDMYEIQGRVYFSELTFFPVSGWMQFNPEEWDEIIGGWLTLPDKTLN